MNPVAVITNLINHVYSKEQLHKVNFYIRFYIYLYMIDAYK